MSESVMLGGQQRGAHRQWIPSMAGAKRLIAACAVAGAFAFAPATTTLAGHMRGVSVGDPFASCVGVGGDTNKSGVNYASGEVEPWVADNPDNPRNLIGSWQQDRWSDGGAKGLVASYSFDSGKRWGETPLPFSLCAAPYYDGAVLQYDRTSDPWDSIGREGNAYAVSISFNANDNNNSVGAATSSDGGRTWRNTQTIIADSTDDPAQPFNDKESVTADPTTAGYAYAVWDRLANVACGPATPRRRPDSDDHKLAHTAATAQIRAQAAQALDCFEGPTYFSRTTNGGRTWEPARPIVSNFVNQQTIGNQIVVDHRTGTLYDFFDYIDYRTNQNGDLYVEVVSSSDKGATWSAPQIVNTLGSVGVHDPKNPNNGLRTGDIIPEPAIDPNTGQLYVVWQDARFNGGQNDQVVIATSTAGGLTGTWSSPRLVNPAGDPAAFTPAITVNDRGQVGVSYYDFRAPEPDPAAHILPTDTWLTTTDGPGVAFTRETRIGGPYNMLAAPQTAPGNGGGYFVGDYEGLTADVDGKFFHPFFVQTDCADNSCDAVGTPDGSPAGPDSTDVFADRGKSRPD